MFDRIDAITAEELHVTARELFVDEPVELTYL